MEQEKRPRKRKRRVFAKLVVVTFLYVAAASLSGHAELIPFFPEFLKGFWVLL